MAAKVKTSIPTLPEGVKKPKNPYLLFANEVREAAPGLLKGTYVWKVSYLLVRCVLFFDVTHMK